MERGGAVARGEVTAFLHEQLRHRYYFHAIGVNGRVALSRDVRAAW